MTRYRRAFVPGGTYLFTVDLQDRQLSLLVEHVELLRAAFRYVHDNHPFVVEAIVVLPDHLHAVWTLPAGDDDFPLRWRLIKAAFSRNLERIEPISLSRAKHRERGIWQRRYWEHVIRDQQDFNRHLDYVHFNPVKHGYASQVGDWPYSSFRRMVRLGQYPEQWTAGEDVSGNFGERE